MKERRLFGLVAALLLLLAHAANATVYTGTSAGRAASANFVVNGDVLTLTLSNTFAGDTLVPTDVLTAVFFGGTNTLVPESAVIAPGSLVLNAAFPPGGVVGGEWAFATGIAGPGGTTNGVSSSGFGLFGSASFPGSDLWPPAAVDGLQGGLVSQGDNPATGNAPILSEPLVRSEVIFTFTGATGFDPAAIGPVWFQAGTDLIEPGFPGCTPGPCGGSSTPIPEPKLNLAIVGGGTAILMGLVGFTRRKKGRHDVA